MKCCSAQITGVWEDPAATLRKIHRLVPDARDAGAEIIAFPEQFATGWDPASHRNIEDLSGTIVTTLREYARENGIAIVGSFRQAASPLPKNTAVMIDRMGAVKAVYAKMHPFAYAGEEQHYSAGDDVAVFELGGLRLGIAICYDLRFPEIFRIYADRGVHGVIVPSAWPRSRLRHWDLFIRARAAENQMYVVGVNTTGTTPAGEYAGGSMTAGPDGSVLARAGESETLLLSDLDAGAVEEVRRAFPVHKDRQTGTYARLSS